MIIPMKSGDALAHFKKSYSVTMGGEAAFAVGPIGRNGNAELMTSSAGVNTAVSVSNSKGLYAGLTLEGWTNKNCPAFETKF